MYYSLFDADQTRGADKSATQERRVLESPRIYHHRVKRRFVVTVSYSTPFIPTKMLTLRRQSFQHKHGWLSYSFCPSEVEKSLPMLKRGCYPPTYRNVYPGTFLGRLS